MKLTVELLDKKKHDRQAFDCGLSAVNEFLQKQASRQMGQKINRTWLLVDRSESGRHLAQIAGFFTLTTATVVTDPLTDRSEAFFRKYGFHQMNRSFRDRDSLYLPMGIVKTLVEQELPAQAGPTEERVESAQEDSGADRSVAPENGQRAGGFSSSNQSVGGGFGQGHCHGRPETGQHDQAGCARGRTIARLRRNSGAYIAAMRTTRIETPSW